MDDIIKEFLVESGESLDKLDRDLLVLERDPGNGKCIDRIFRALHTIKGTCGFLGFHRLERVAHTGENLLQRLREKSLPWQAEMGNALLKTVDAIRLHLECLEQAGKESEEENEALIDLLMDLLNGSLHSSIQFESSFPPDESTFNPPSNFEETIPPPPRLGELLVAQGVTTRADIDQALQSQSQGDRRPIGEILAENAQVPPEVITQNLEVQSKARKGDAADSSIRVDVGLLERLMNQVGELVLARNQILQCTTRIQDPDFLGAAQRLSLITTELQEGVMKTRMQPIGIVFGRFPRVVRDVAQQLGKRVKIEIEGAETELDRSILEAIKDPLTHIVRNSIDHGIEGPGDRENSGKPAEGTLRLRAFHEGGQVNIEISDDGRGIDPERIKRKALEKGLITPQAAAMMSAKELVHLIFLPGFSTAEAVTNISGRGVGMDVVRTNIERIGGTVDLSGLPGKGTVTRIKIPLTLAIIPALIVGCHEQRYAIPQVNLVELLRLEGPEGRAKIEHIHGTPVYRLRGELLPLTFLGNELWNTGEEIRPPEGDDSLSIVVLTADGHPFGLVVDEVRDTVEIVVKPLSKHLKGIPVFAGATILGDGKVSLILDVMGLAQKANIFSGGAAVTAGSGVKEDAQDGSVEILLCRGPDDARWAIPLSVVSRLEEIDPATIEHTGSLAVVQYRDTLLPLIRISDILPERRIVARTNLQPGEKIPVVVHDTGGQPVGLMVDAIVDIIRESLVAQRPGSRYGVSGCRVLQERITEILDMETIVRAGLEASS
jgi:two-component system chemotaxis sensor kinase CheA